MHLKHVSMQRRPSVGSTTQKDAILTTSFFLDVLEAVNGLMTRKNISGT